MQILIESYRQNKIIEMLEADKKQIDSITGNAKGIFIFSRDTGCMNKINLSYNGLNMIQKKVLFEGFKFKIHRIDRNAKIKKI